MSDRKYYNYVEGVVRETWCHRYDAESVNYFIARGDVVVRHTRYDGRPGYQYRKLLRPHMSDGLHITATWSPPLHPEEYPAWLALYLTLTQ